VKLFHYSARPFRFNRRRRYERDHWKPHGLWLSVEGENDWRAWCEGENWGIDKLKNVSEVVLAPDANVLIVDTLAKLDAFNTLYGSDNDRSYSIAWEKVKAMHDGIIIAPYQWERRYSFMWYYGWDCASGVIWNLPAIANVTLPSNDQAEPLPPDSERDRH